MLCLRVIITEESIIANSRKYQQKQWKGQKSKHEEAMEGGQNSRVEKNTSSRIYEYYSKSEWNSHFI